MQLSGLKDLFGLLSTCMENLSQVCIVPILRAVGVVRKVVVATNGVPTDLAGNVLHLRHRRLQVGYLSGCGDAWICSCGCPSEHLNTMSTLDTISWQYGKEGFSHHLIREACL